MWTVSDALPREVGLELEDAKIHVRAAVRRHRQGRPERERQQAAEAIAVHARSLLENVSCVAAYAARPGEPDTGPLLDLLDGAGIEILLPVLGPGLSRDWALFTARDDLKVRAPGRPPEPPGPGLGETAVSRADLIIAPALGVDLEGMRLGQGGGWYDRALAHARAGVLVYAMIYDDERCTEPLPAAGHDRPVDGILTPSGAHRLR